MEKNNLTIPYIVFESVMDKADRRDKRNILIIGILVLLLAITNITWLLVWNSYDYAEDYTSVEAEQEGDGINIAGAGDINYGTEGKDHSQNEDKDSE